MAVDWDAQEYGFRSVTRALAKMRREPPPPWLDRHPELAEDPIPASIAELAEQWLTRWDAADDAERMEMRSEQLTDELKDAVRSLRASRKASK